MRAKVRRREGEGGRNSGFGGEVKSYTLERSSAALEQVYESDVLVGNNLFLKYLYLFHFLILTVALYKLLSVVFCFFFFFCIFPFLFIAICNVFFKLKSLLLHFHTIYFNVLLKMPLLLSDFPLNCLSHFLSRFRFISP